MLLFTGVYVVMAVAAEIFISWGHILCMIVEVAEYTNYTAKIELKFSNSPENVVPSYWIYHLEVFILINSSWHRYIVCVQENFLTF